MEQILKIIGWLFIIIGIGLALYVGIYIMFYGGIVQIINSINPLNSVGIAIGICRIVFCEIAGLIPLPIYLIGIYLLDKSEEV